MKFVEGYPLSLVSHPASPSLDRFSVAESERFLRDHRTTHQSPREGLLVPDGIRLLGPIFLALTEYS